jgi:hypothetical protein
VRLVIPIIGIVDLAIPVYGDLQPGQAAPDNSLPYLTTDIIVVGVLYTVILGARRPGTFAKVPGLLEGLNSLKRRESLLS